MEMVSLFLPSTNQFATQYTAPHSPVEQFFHYRYTDRESFQQRVKDISQQHFRRDQLCNYIETYMSKFVLSESSKHSIEKLRLPNSMVVVGGQQAGLLTGPLYSIHKILSIVHLAKEQEQLLNIPVVPVFWIAGEDHDYDEVNHLFIEKTGKLEKMVYPYRAKDKRMISDLAFDKEEMKNWIELVFATYGETDHSKQLLQDTFEMIQHSETFVDFFARIVLKLFDRYGLLLVDSGDKGIRELEKEFFIELIKNNETITARVKHNQSELRELGFKETITISEQCANLFYYDEEFFERILLEYDPEQKLFIGKEGTIQFSVDELLTIANEYPHKLSNNVVTRPLMQEWLFPTLAFIAGPGEIAYWAELKGAFEHMGMKMPPIVPRLNVTIVERNIASDIDELGLGMDNILIAGTDKEKKLYLEENRDVDYERLFGSLQDAMEKTYVELGKKMALDYPGLLDLLKKNEQVIGKQLQFMESKIDLALRDKLSYRIEKYERIERRLKPDGSPQERLWNIYYFLNQFGMDFVDQLLDLPYEFDGKHYVVYM